mgnify:CR=1 FL=1
MIVVVLLAGKFHAHHLYHWMDHTLYHEYMVEHGDHVHYVDEMEEGAVLNPNFDHVIAGKKAYFFLFMLGTMLRPAVSLDPSGSSRSMMVCAWRR